MPYGTSERAVVLVVIRAMGFDEAVGDYDCFLAHKTIAKRAGCAVRTVMRLLQRHCNGKRPLLARSSPGHTRGHPHRCFRWTLVRNPEAFAAARDASRVDKVVETRPALKVVETAPVQVDRVVEPAPTPVDSGAETKQALLDKVAGICQALDDGDLRTAHALKCRWSSNKISDEEYVRQMSMLAGAFGQVPHSKRRDKSAY